VYPASTDPSGTSVNPSVDGEGTRVAFESTGNLARESPPPGGRHIFVRDPDGTIRRLSRGLGVSRNPVLSPRRKLLLFESSSHPVSGAETGIAQIWLGDVETGPLEPITAGAGPSTNPSASNDARLVVFESEADLAGTRAKTGVSQVYAYDRKSAMFARITQDPQGCHLPSAYKVKRDWRIAYVCDGKPYFTMLRANQRFEVQADGGTTQRMLAGLGSHFVVVSTRADLMSGQGSTPGNQVYLVNLYRREPKELSGSPPVTWFPTQGIPPL
jgi:Tol biopolymer transport system component